MENEGQEQVQIGGSFSPRIFFRILSFLVAIAVGGAGIYYLAKSRPQLLGLPVGQLQVQAEVDQLVSEVGKLIALPSDEKPTVATVTDVEKLKEQPFFKNAQNGDKVLIYTNAKKAILYRPNEKRIVEVGAVNINQASPSPESSPTATPQATKTPTPSRQQQT